MGSDICSILICLGIWLSLPGNKSSINHLLCYLLTWFGQCFGHQGGELKKKKRFHFSQIPSPSSPPSPFATWILD